MNAKAIIPLILFLIIPPLTGLARAEEVATAREKPDFNNAEWIKKILAEAIMRDTITERGLEGAKLFYAPDGQTPFTGWIKRLHDNGKLKSLGYCKDGKANGSYGNWHENGQKVGECTYKNGQMEGSYTMWHENGKKLEEGTIKNGQLEGIVTKWNNIGEKESEFTFKEGKQEGVATRRHENGKMEGEVRFKEGKPEGSYTNWHDNGQKAGEGTYKNGQLEGLITQWNEDGEVLRQTRFKNGKQVFENEPDLADAETLKKILGMALKWDALQKDELTGLYHLPDNPEPYTGWIQKPHDNGKVALLGALKDGKPDGLWTWWDENGNKEDEKRYPATSP